MELEGIVLDQGDHMTVEQGMCAMEAAAFLAREPHSSRPKCACPVVTEFVQCLNDAAGPERQRLVAYLPRLVGSRASEEVTLKRAFKLLNLGVKKLLPIVPELDEPQRSAIHTLAEIVDIPTAVTARALLEDLCEFSSAGSVADNLFDAVGMILVRPNTVDVSYLIGTALEYFVIEVGGAERPDGKLMINAGFECLDEILKIVS